MSPAARLWRAVARAWVVLAVCLVPAIAGAQGRFCIDRDTIVFGDRPVGSATTVNVTVTNCGSGSFGFTDVSVIGSTGYNVASACTSGTTLQAGQSCSATITFAPTFGGQQSGALWLRNTTSTPAQLVTFYGRGTTAAAGSSSLAFSPSTLQFGDQVVGSGSGALRVDLQNKGSVAITPTALVVNGPAAYDFLSQGDCAVGRPIPAGGSCHLDFVFTPGAAGVRLANLNVDAPQLASLAILRMSGNGVEAPNVPPAADIVEFHHAVLDHYFLTAEAAEVDFIDRGGLGSAWTRTGRRLRGWTMGTAAPGVVDACRFFGTPGNGPDSHFYTVNAAECAGVKTDPHWQYEGLAFRVLPLVNGACGPKSDLVQRLFKPAVDVTGIRHRYVVAQGDVDAMVGAGWVLEGPVFCSVG